MTLALPAGQATAYLPFLPLICPCLTAIPPSAFFFRNATSFATVSANRLVIMLTLSFFIFTFHLEGGEVQLFNNDPALPVNTAS